MDCQVHSHSQGPVQPCPAAAVATSMVPSACVAQNVVFCGLHLFVSLGDGRWRTVGWWCGGVGVNPIPAGSTTSLIPLTSACHLSAVSWTAYLSLTQHVRFLGMHGASVHGMTCSRYTSAAPILAILLHMGIDCGSDAGKLFVADRALACRGDGAPFRCQGC